MYKNLSTLPTVLSNKDIEDCIYNIRDKQVMLDSDIAELSEVETKYLNKQMKRNISRFPEDFCFQLNYLEFNDLRFQNATSNHGGRRYLHYVSFLLHLCCTVCCKIVL